MTSQSDLNFDKLNAVNTPLLAGESATEHNGPTLGAPSERSSLNQSQSVKKFTTFSPGGGDPSRENKSVSQLKMSVVHEAAQEVDVSQNLANVNMMKDLDDIENNTDKSIDFHSQLQALKRRTETELSHTLTQTEDIMYLDQYSVIALEYHYYQNDCKYLNLMQCDEHLNDDGDLVNSNGEKVTHLFSTEKYQKNQDSIHPMSAFERQDITNYVEDSQDILKHEKNLAKPNFMKVTNEYVPLERTASRIGAKVGQKLQSMMRKPKNNKEEPKMVEAILALYKVSPLGGMQRSNQVDVKMGRKFHISENGNMVLTRSKDKKVVSLTNFDPHNENGEYFRTLAWTNKLKKFETADEFELLNTGMSFYYNEVKDTFDELVEVSFVGNSKFVQLIYIEAKPRSLVEQQLFEQQIQEELAKSKNQNVDTYAMRSTPRKARKYVFFDACSGKVVFEYGGAKTPMLAMKPHGEECEIYELGLLVKEIREEAFNPQLCFFFTGDFMDPQIKEQQVIFQWAMNSVLIGMKQLFEMESPEEQKDLIETHIRAVICKGQVDGYLNYYPFDQSWILNHKFSWEQNMVVSSNRKFSQYAILNMREENDQNNNGSTTFYVHGPQFRDLVKVQNLKTNNYILDVAYFAKLPGDAKCRHTRNSNVKDQLFYDVIKNNEVKTYCLRLDHLEPRSKVMVARIPMSNIVSQNDIWLQFRRNKSTNIVEDIFQTIHISRGDQTGILSTKLPKSMRNINSSDQDDIVERRTNMFYQYQADLPCICYNLGDSKVILQNTLQTDNMRNYIVNLHPDEKFVCFLQFNQFEDIGFYAKGLRIECCSHFAFLTAGKGPSAGHIHKNRINLIVIDPFYEKTQVAHFRSCTHYDNEIFNMTDTIVTSMIQSTMGKKRDLKFKTYIWSQFPQNLIRSSMVKCINGQILAEDSDRDEYSDREDDEEISGKFTYEQVRMVMSERDFIYYITKKNGKCYIMEGNPRDQYIDHHEAIFCLKAERCLAFNVVGSDQFYFMDECHQVHKLSRNQNNRSLIHEKEMTMKEIQRLDFQPFAFDHIIMNEKYAIQGSKIFYLYDLIGDPFPEGIFEAEDLIEEDKSKSKYNYSKGPISMSGSHRFFNVYQIDKFTSKIKLFQKPDETEKPLINDFLNWVDMSTFLENGKIMIKIRRRFMIFTNDGAFIDEVEFNDDILKTNELNDKDRPKINYQTFKEQKAHQMKLKEDVQSNITKLERRRGKNQILDFVGHKYEFKPSDPPVPLSHNNKMELLNFSYNNRFFLFYNRMSESLCLYEMCEISVVPNQDESFFDFKDLPQPKMKNSYQFVFKHIINYDKTPLFYHLYTIGIDPIEYYRSNLSQIMVDDSGNVKICYVENLPFVDKQNQSGYSERAEGSDVEMIQCRLIGSIFSPVQDEFQMKAQSFTQVFDFPRDAQLKLANLYELKKQDLDRKINNIRAVQARLPKKLFDYGQFENLIDDLLELEGKSADNVYAKVYSDNLIVVYSGQYVKFGKLIPNKKKTKKSSKDVMDLVLQKSEGQYLRDMAAHLSNDTEVVKIIETLNNNWLQVMMWDHLNDIFTVVTWDFNNNMEQCILQMYESPDEDVGYHVIKGMNQKRNYFLNQNYLSDLEYNIPLRQTNVNQNLNLQCYSYRKQLQMINDFYNQRKLYEDSSKFLGVEKAFCLFYPLSRMDLVLWQNINMLGEKPELIQQTCTLRQCNLVIDGISLFHYYADNSELIEQIHARYSNEKQNNTLLGTDKTLPLQILNPDNNGKTALFLAVASQSPASFECMIDMLKEFPEQCISKMMLKSLALILSHESSQVIDFFESNVFQPPQMQIQQFIPWGDDMEEFIFPSHTSIISKQLLYQKLAEQGVVQEPTIQKPKPKSDNAEEEDGEQLTRRQKIIQSKKQLRKLVLDAEFDNGLNEGEEPLKRVQIECLDLDWIFDGDNAKILLSVLASEANNSALTKKSIRIFVDLMWSKYQTAIIKFIFVPYMAYLFVLSQLAGSVAGEFIDILYEDVENDAEAYQKYFVLKIKCYVLTAIATSLMICFGSLEMKQMITDGIEYFSDYWNCIDATSLSINSSFLLMVTYNCIGEIEHFNVQLVRTFGAFACFFMWIKVFYWMRLFSSLAYYVKLIQQTISDSMNFMLMVFLIILSFANFYYVIDRNLVTSDAGSRYYDQYTSTPEINHSIVDVIISIYMMGALGDFDSTIYRVGYDRYFAIFMFLLATFIISVVFMNMLIAIMGDTFGQVLEVAEESGLREQVVLIADHAWLLDLKKIFKGQKYIIRVQPSTSTQDSENVVVDQVKEAETTIVKKLARLQDFVQKRVDSVDGNTRFLLKYQQISIEGVTRRIKGLEKMFKATTEVEQEDLAHLDEEQKELLMQQKKKKNEILHMLNSQTSGQTLTIDKVQEVALNWMELADKDGNGELDFQEFYDFFSKIEDIVVTEQEIRQIFDDFDGSGNGYLSVEEFARAIYQAVLADQDEYSEDDYGFEQDV